MGPHGPPSPFFWPTSLLAFHILTGCHSSQRSMCQVDRVRDWWELVDRSPWATTSQDQSYLWELLPQLQIPNHKLCKSLPGLVSQPAVDQWFDLVWIDNVRRRMCGQLILLLLHSHLTTGFLKGLCNNHSVNKNSQRISLKVLTLSAKKQYLQVFPASA